MPHRAQIKAEIRKGNKSQPNLAITIKSVNSTAINPMVKQQKSETSRILPEGAIKFLVDNDLTSTIKLINYVNCVSDYIQLLALLMESMEP